MADAMLDKGEDVLTEGFDELLGKDYLTRDLMDLITHPNYDHGVARMFGRMLNMTTSELKTVVMTEEGEPND